jgi:hypothetical protein
MLSWLVGYTLASIVAAFVIVRIFDYIFAGVSGNIVAGARLGLFVGAWTVVTAKAGMHTITRQARQLRHGNASAMNRINAIVSRRKLK